MGHTHGRPDNQQEHLDDLLGRGRGDPDIYGYPGQKPDKIKHIRGNKLVIEHIKVKPDRYSWLRRQAAKDLNISEDNLPDEPDEMADHSDDQGWS